MTDKEMHLELKKNEILDNPFDTMLRHSIELTILVYLQRSYT